jgi:hypothetical protein
MLICILIILVIQLVWTILAHASANYKIDKLQTDIDIVKTFVITGKQKSGNNK